LFLRGFIGLFALNWVLKKNDQLDGFWNFIGFQLLE